MVMAFFLVACGGNTVVVGPDTGTGETGAADSDSGADTDTAADSGTDSGGADSGDTDSGGDTDTGGGVDPDAPTCVIVSPATGFAQPYTLAFTFVASATDPQDGAVPGAAIAWSSSAGGASLGTGTTVTVSLAASGPQTITCTATDADGKTGTASILVTSISPVIEIWHPGDGEIRAAGSEIPWIGRGNDLEDGALTGGSLVWTSNLDGEFGTGEELNAPLSIGTHVITLTGTDSDGNTGADGLTLTIE